MSDYYIGLMSGSSLDGIDAVLVDFSCPPLKLLGQHSHPIAADLRTELDALTRPGTDELIRMSRADARFGELLADAVMVLLSKTGVAAVDIKAIGSHGQTLRHYPDIPCPTTLQIGDPNRLAERTGITTVADLRRRDMAAGGQGAPLVPAFHQAMFRHEQDDRVILNIGGIANLTLLPANQDKPVSGFDTGPGNALMDAWIERHRQQACDLAGHWAASGQVIPELLSDLLDEAFFRQMPPKSTGRDVFSLDWLDSHLVGRDYPAEDVQATLLRLTARSTAEAIRQHAPDYPQLLVCGGGVHNTALMQQLGELLANMEVQSTAQVGLDPDWVEAVAFAWLARQTLLHKAGNLPSATGAHRSVILGGIYPGSAASAP